VGSIPLPAVGGGFIAQPPHGMGLLTGKLVRKQATHYSYIRLILFTIFGAIFKKDHEKDHYVGHWAELSKQTFSAMPGMR
jgi:hypothetical protein